MKQVTYDDSFWHRVQSRIVFAISKIDLGGMALLPNNVRSCNWFRNSKSSFCAGIRAARTANIGETCSDQLVRIYTIVGRRLYYESSCFDHDLRVMVSCLSFSRCQTHRYSLCNALAPSHQNPRASKTIVGVWGFVDT